MKISQQLFALIYVFVFPSFLYAQSDLSITHAWVREAPPRSTVMAAYMTIQNPQPEAVVIHKISSPDFEKVEIHLSTESNGIAKMLPQKKLMIAAQSKVELKSGAYHLMLINPKKRFKHKDFISLNLFFNSDDSLSINVPVLKDNSKKTMKCGAGKCGAD